MVTAPALLLALATAGSSETVLLEFSASWCAPCRTMEPIVRQLADAGFPIRQIDVDQHPEIAKRYRVTALPTFVMVAGGREVERIEGVASFERLQQMAARMQLGMAPAQSVRGQSPSRPRRPWNLFGRGKQSEPEPAIQPPQVAMPRAAEASPLATRPDVSPIDRALAATVRIKVEDAHGHAFGTGTIIDVHGTEALAITCGHIFRESAGKGPTTVETFAGGAQQGVVGTLISYNLEMDIGLVSFSPSTSVIPAPVAASGEAIRGGVEVFSIGCDHGRAPSVQQSRITAVDKYVRPPNIEVAGQPVVGRSGGGLFNAKGELIGICNFADPADNEGIYASLAVVHWELDRIGQRRIYQPDATALAKAAQSVRPNTQVATVTPDMPVRMPSTPNRTPVASKPATNDTEVICIVRSRSNPNGPSRVFVLNQPSQGLLNQLAGEAANTSNPGLVPVGSNPQLSPVVRAQSDR